MSGEKVLVSGWVELDGGNVMKRQREVVFLDTGWSCT